MAEERVYTIAEAAKRLGITQDACRKRVKRGLLAAERLDGRVYVRLDRLDYGPSPESNVLDNGRDTGRTAWEALVSQLQSENAFLRSELQARTEELARRDTLLQQALQRIPELPPHSESSPASVAVDPGPKRPWWQFWH